MKVRVCLKSLTVRRSWVKFWIGCLENHDNALLNFPFISRGIIVMVLSLICFILLKMLLSMPNLNELKSLFVIDRKKRKGVKDIIAMLVAMMTGIRVLNLLL